MPHLHRLVLLAAWYEQILFHAPVEEGADLVGVDHLEAGKFVHHGKWLVGGDHRLAVSIQIEEDLHIVLLLDPFRQLAPGQQQFTVLPSREPGATVFEFNDVEGVHLANLYHGALFFFTGWASWIRALMAAHVTPKPAIRPSPHRNAGPRLWCISPPDRR